MIVCGQCVNIRYTSVVRAEYQPAALIPTSRQRKSLTWVFNQSYSYMQYEWM